MRSMTRGSWISEFGNNLYELIEGRGMTQRELAKDSGVSESMISDYINKFSAPSVITVINLTYALDVDVDELVNFGDRID